MAELPETAAQLADRHKETDHPAGQPTAARRLVGIVLCCTGAFIAFLDSTIVNVAFPDIRASFSDADLSTLSWVLNGYNVLFAALLLPAGRAADRFGRRRTFTAGLVIFTAASVLCAAANSVELLVAARVLQGAGAAVLVPTSLAILLTLFPKQNRMSAVTLWGAAAAVAAGIGPALGGFLTEEWSWRTVFLVNIPIGLVAIYACRFLREQKDRTKSLPDVIGAVFLAFCFGLLSLGIVKGHDWGWTDPLTLCSMVAAAVFAVAVGFRSVHHPVPAIAPNLLRERNAITGNIGTLLFAVAFYGLILNNVLFLNGYWGWSITESGLALTPAPLFAAATARPAGKLAERVGEVPVILLGCLICSGGIVLLVWGAGQSADFVSHWLPGAACVGMGIGMAYPGLTGLALKKTAEDQLATATATNAVARQVGGVLGTALIISILAADTSDPLGATRTGWWVMAAFTGTAALAAISSMIRRPGARSGA